MGSINFNGKSFADSDINFILETQSFAIPAEPIYNEYQTRSRTILQNTAWAPQLITINGIIIGSSFADATSKYRLMLGYLYATSGQPLIISNDSDIEYTCKLSTAPSAERIGDRSVRVEIEFISTEIGKDTSDTVINGTVGDLICDTSESNYFVYPVINMTGLTPGATITVSTPSSQDSLTMTAYDSTILDITSAPGSKFVSSGVTSKMAFLADGSTYPRLLAFDATNVVRISVSAGTSTTTITYRNSYQ